MDVAAAADPTSRLIEPSLPPASPAPAPVPDSRAGDAVAPPDPVESSALDGRSSAVPQPGAPTLPPPPSKKDGPISDDVIKLFNQQQQNVEVSYRVEKGIDEVVTVFTDKTTGKTIVQFPSETLIALARLFDKIAGSVLDKKA